MNIQMGSVPQEMMSVTPFDVGSIEGTVTLDRANGSFQKATLSGDVTFNAPSGGAFGKRIKLVFDQEGAFLVNFNWEEIKFEARDLFPTSVCKYIILLQHNGTMWELIFFSYYAPGSNPTSWGVAMIGILNSLGWSL